MAGKVYKMHNVGENPDSNDFLTNGFLALYNPAPQYLYLYNASNIDGLLVAWYRYGNTLHMIINATSQCSFYNYHTGTSGLTITPVSVGISDSAYGAANAEIFFEIYDNYQEAYNAITNYIVYPITYSSSNSTVSGPSEAAVGDTVTVSAVPNAGYGITDASTQILVTNNDVAVPYTWDATNNRITFTMPDPS